VRWLVVAILINGLAPGFAEAGEAVVHYVETGHLAHPPGEDDRGDLGDEHSCGVVFHHCGCCAAMNVLPQGRVDVGRPASVAKDGAPVALSRIANRSLEPPFRPPIR
jgi:hypothetical protein